MKSNKLTDIYDIIFAVFYLGGFGAAGLLLPFSLLGTSDPLWQATSYVMVGCFIASGTMCIIANICDFP